MKVKRGEESSKSSGQDCKGLTHSYYNLPLTNTGTHTKRHTQQGTHTLTETCTHTKVSAAFCLLVFRLSMTTAKVSQKTSKDFVNPARPAPTRGTLLLPQSLSHLPLSLSLADESRKLCEKFKSLWRWQLFGTFACRLCQT